MRVDRVEFAAALARADLNVKQLAELTGLSRGTVTGVKTGKSCSRRTAEKLTEVLGSSIMGTQKEQVRASAPPVGGPRPRTEA